MFLAGNVVFADVLTTPNGRSKGCGIVEYATHEEAQKAVEKLSNLELEGRQIYVREDREVEPKFNARPGVPPVAGAGRPVSSTPEGAQIFVTNLPYSIRWQELKDFFAQSGEVIRAEVQQNHMGRSKGCGTVLFADPAVAEIAIQTLNGTDLGGRNIEVREDRFVKRQFGGAGGFPARGGRGGASYKSSRFPPKQYADLKPNPFTDGASGNGEPSETVFISNLPWATTDNDLVELAQTVGHVVHAEIQLEPSGRSAGSGVVKFDSVATAQIAIDRFVGYEYGNRALGLSFVAYAPVQAHVAPAAAAVAPSPAAPAAVSAVPAAAASAAPIPALSTEPSV